MNKDNIIKMLRELKKENLNHQCNCSKKIKIDEMIFFIIQECEKRVE